MFTRFTRLDTILDVQVTAEDIPRRALRFSVYDVDKRRVRHSLGHAVINLRALDLTRGDVIQARLEPTVKVRMEDWFI